MTELRAFSEPRALCPQCGRLAIKETVRQDDATTLPVQVGTFSDERGHVWQTKWMVEEA